MKRLLHSLMFILSHLILRCQSSIYYPLPDSNTIWNFNLQSNCFANGQANENYSLIITGDTIINNSNYHKLFTPYVQSFSTGTCGGIPINYKGCFRQDITNRIVYYIPPNDTIEHLLYDFNLQVGDTVQGFLQQIAFPADTVISIDSVLVGNSYRKRWNINNGYGIAIIEGIGSTYGFFESSPGGLLDFPDYSLSCFQQNSTFTFPNNINCQIITSVSSVSQEKVHLKLSPNPTNGIVNFQSNQVIRKIQVFSLEGQEVLTVEKPIQKQIDLSKLDNGVYLLTVLLKDGRINTSKIIKR